MSEYVTFDGVVEPLIWGKATYTILRLPEDVVQSLNGVKRVEGEIAEHPVNLALTRAPVVEGVFLWAGQSLLSRTGIALGQPVEVRLRPAPADRVDLDEDVEAALRSHDLSGQWAALKAGRQRSLLYQISTAKTPVTRAKRISKLMQDVADASK